MAVSPTGGVREFLRTARAANLERRRCEHRVRELEEQAKRLSSPLGNATPGGSFPGGLDPHRDGALIALAEASRRLEEAARNLEARRLAVDKLLLALPKPEYRLVLQLRYIDGLSWRRIEQEVKRYGLYYSDRQIFRIHRDALGAAANIWEAWFQCKQNN